MLMMRLACWVKRNDGEYECNIDGLSIATDLVLSCQDPQRFGHVRSVNETRYDRAILSREQFSKAKVRVERMHGV